MEVVAPSKPTLLLEGDNGMVVKRLSVPLGLEELMESLTKQVLLKKPQDIYSFASEHFAHLLEIREKQVSTVQPSGEGKYEDVRIKTATLGTKFSTPVIFTNCNTTNAAAGPTSPSPLTPKESPRKDVVATIPGDARDSKSAASSVVSQKIIKDVKTTARVGRAKWQKQPVTKSILTPKTRPPINNNDNKSKNTNNTNNNMSNGKIVDDNRQTKPAKRSLSKDSGVIAAGKRNTTPRLARMMSVDERSMSVKGETVNLTTKAKRKSLLPKKLSEESTDNVQKKVAAAGAAIGVTAAAVATAVALTDSANDAGMSSVAEISDSILNTDEVDGDGQDGVATDGGSDTTRSETVDGVTDAIETAINAIAEVSLNDEEPQDENAAEVVAAEVEAPTDDLVQEIKDDKNEEIIAEEEVADKKGQEIKDESKENLDDSAVVNEEIVVENEANETNDKEITAAESATTASDETQEVKDDNKEIIVENVVNDDDIKAQVQSDYLAEEVSEVKDESKETVIVKNEPIEENISANKDVEEDVNDNDTKEANDVEIQAHTVEEETTNAENIDQESITVEEEATSAENVDKALITVKEEARNAENIDKESITIEAADIQHHPTSNDAALQNNDDVKAADVVVQDKADEDETVKEILINEMKSIEADDEVIKDVLITAAEIDTNTNIPLEETVAMKTNNAAPLNHESLELEHLQRNIIDNAFGDVVEHNHIDETVDAQQQHTTDTIPEEEDNSQLAQGESNENNDEGNAIDPEISPATADNIEKQHENDKSIDDATTMDDTQRNGDNDVDIIQADNANNDDEPKLDELLQQTQTNDIVNQTSDIVDDKEASKSFLANETEHEQNVENVEQGVVEVAEVHIDQSAVQSNESANVENRETEEESSNETGIEEQHNVNKTEQPAEEVPTATTIEQNVIQSNESSTNLEKVTSEVNADATENAQKATIGENVTEETKVTEIDDNVNANSPITENEEKKQLDNVELSSEPTESNASETKPSEDASQETSNVVILPGSKSEGHIVIVHDEDGAEIETSANSKSLQHDAAAVDDEGPLSLEQLTKYFEDKDKTEDDAAVGGGSEDTVEQSVVESINEKISDLKNLIEDGGTDVAVLTDKVAELKNALVNHDVIEEKSNIIATTQSFVEMEKNAYHDAEKVNNAFGDAIDTMATATTQQEHDTLISLHHNAATNIQSVWRDGRQACNNRDDPKMSLIQTPADCDELPEHRGEAAADVVEDDADRAAVLIQSLIRGHLVRKQYSYARQQPQDGGIALPPVLEEDEKLVELLDAVAEPPKEEDEKLVELLDAVPAPPNEEPTTQQHTLKKRSLEAQAAVDDDDDVVIDENTADILIIDDSSDADKSIVDSISEKLSSLRKLLTSAGKPAADTTPLTSSPTKQAEVINETQENLIQHIPLKGDDDGDTLAAKLNQAVGDVKENVLDLKEVGEVQLESAAQKIIDVKEIIEAQVDEVKEIVEIQVEEVKEVVEAQVEEVKEVVEAQVEEVKEVVEAQVEEVKEVVEAQVEEVVEAKLEAASVAASTESIKEIIAENANNLKDNVDNQISDAVANSKVNEHKLDEVVAIVKNEEEVPTIETTVADIVENFEQKAVDVTDDVIVELDNKIADVESQIEDVIEQVKVHKNDFTATHLEEAISDGKGAMQHIKEAAVNDVKDVSANLEEKIVDVEGKVDAAVQEIKEHVDVAENNAANEINEPANDVKNNVSEKMENKIVDAEHKIENALHEVKAHVDDAKHTAKEASQDITDNVAEQEEKIANIANKIGDEIEDIKDSVTQDVVDTTKTIVEEIKEATNDVKDDAVGHLEQNLDNAKNAAEEIKEAVGDIKDDAVASLEQKVDEAKNTVEEIKEAVGDVRDDAVAHLEEKVDDAKNTAEEIKEVVDNVKDDVVANLEQKVEDAKNTSEEIKEAVGDVKDDTVAHLEEKVDDAKNTVEEIKEAVDNVTDDVVANLEQKVEDAKNTAKEIKEVVGDVKDDAVAHLEEKVHDAKNSAEGIKEAVGDAKDDLAAHIEQDIAEVEHKIDDTVQEIKEASDDVQTAVKALSDDVAENIEQKILNVEHEIDDRLEEIKQHIYGAKNVAEEIKEGASDVKDDVTVQMEENIADIEHKIDETVQHDIDHANKVAEEIIEVVEDDVGTHVEKKINQVEQRVDDTVDEIKEDVNAIVDVVKNVVEDGKETVNEESVTEKMNIEAALQSDIDNLQNILDTIMVDNVESHDLVAEQPIIEEQLTNQSVIAVENIKHDLESSAANVQEIGQDALKLLESQIIVDEEGTDETANANDDKLIVDNNNENENNNNNNNNNNKILNDDDAMQNDVVNAEKLAIGAYLNMLQDDMVIKSIAMNNNNEEMSTDDNIKFMTKLIGAAIKIQSLFRGYRVRSKQCREENMMRSADITMSEILSKMIDQLEMSADVDDDNGGVTIEELKDDEAIEKFLNYEDDLRGESTYDISEKLDSVAESVDIENLPSETTLKSDENENVTISDNLSGTVTTEDSKVEDDQEELEESESNDTSNIVENNVDGKTESVNIDETPLETKTEEINLLNDNTEDVTKTTSVNADTQNELAAESETIETVVTDEIEAAATENQEEIIVKETSSVEQETQPINKDHITDSKEVAIIGEADIAATTTDAPTSTIPNELAAESETIETVVTDEIEAAATENQEEIIVKETSSVEQETQPINKDHIADSKEVAIIGEADIAATTTDAPTSTIPNEEILKENVFDEKSSAINDTTQNSGTEETTADSNQQIQGEHIEIDTNQENSNVEEKENLQEEDISSDNKKTINNAEETAHQVVSESKGDSDEIAEKDKSEKNETKEDISQDNDKKEDDKVVNQVESDQTEPKQDSTEVVEEIALKETKIQDQGGKQTENHEKIELPDTTETDMKSEVVKESKDVSANDVTQNDDKIENLPDTKPFKTAESDAKAEEGLVKEVQPVQSTETEKSDKVEETDNEKSILDAVVKSSEAKEEGKDKKKQVESSDDSTEKLDELVNEDIMMVQTEASTQDAAKSETSPAEISTSIDKTDKNESEKANVEMVNEANATIKETQNNAEIQENRTEITQKTVELSESTNDATENIKPEPSTTTTEAQQNDNDQQIKPEEIPSETNQTSDNNNADPDVKQESTAFGENDEKANNVEPQKVNNQQSSTEAEGQIQKAAAIAESILPQNINTESESAGNNANANTTLTQLQENIPAQNEIQEEVVIKEVTLQSKSVPISKSRDEIQVEVIVDESTGTNDAKVVTNLQEATPINQNENIADTKANETQSVTDEIAKENASQNLIDQNEIQEKVTVKEDTVPQETVPENVQESIPANIEQAEKNILETTSNANEKIEESATVSQEAVPTNPDGSADSSSTETQQASVATNAQENVDKIPSKEQSEIQEEATVKDDVIVPEETTSTTNESETKDSNAIDSANNPNEVHQAKENAPDIVNSNENEAVTAKSGEAENTIAANEIVEETIQQENIVKDETISKETNKTTTNNNDNETATIENKQESIERHEVEASADQTPENDLPIDGQPEIKQDSGIETENLVANQEEQNKVQVSNNNIVNDQIRENNANSSKDGTAEAAETIVGDTTTQSDDVAAIIPTNEKAQTADTVAINNDNTAAHNTETAAAANENNTTTNQTTQPEHNNPPMNQDDDDDDDDNNKSALQQLSTDDANQIDANYNNAESNEMKVEQQPTNDDGMGEMVVELDDEESEREINARIHKVEEWLEQKVDENAPPPPVLTTTDTKENQIMERLSASEQRLLVLSNSAIAANRSAAQVQGGEQDSGNNIERDVINNNEGKAKQTASVNQIAIDAAPATTNEQLNISAGDVNSDDNIAELQQQQQQHTDVDGVQNKADAEVNDDANAITTTSNSQITSHQHAQEEVDDAETQVVVNDDVTVGEQIDAVLNDAAKLTNIVVQTINAPNNIIVGDSENTHNKQEASEPKPEENTQVTNNVYDNSQLDTNENHDDNKLENDVNADADTVVVIAEAEKDSETDIKSNEKITEDTVQSEIEIKAADNENEIQEQDEIKEEILTNTSNSRVNAAAASNIEDVNNTHNKIIDDAKTHSKMENQTVVGDEINTAIKEQDAVNLNNEPNDKEVVEDVLTNTDSIHVNATPSHEKSTTNDIQEENNTNNKVNEDAPPSNTEHQPVDDPNTVVKELDAGKIDKELNDKKVVEEVLASTDSSHVNAPPHQEESDQPAKNNIEEVNYTASDITSNEAVIVKAPVNQVVDDEVLPKSDTLQTETPSEAPPKEKSSNETTVEDASPPTSNQIIEENGVVRQVIEIPAEALNLDVDVSVQVAHDDDSTTNRPESFYLHSPNDPPQDNPIAAAIRVTSQITNQEPSIALLHSGEFHDTIPLQFSPTNIQVVVQQQQTIQRITSGGSVRDQQQQQQDVGGGGGGGVDVVNDVGDAPAGVEAVTSSSSSLLGGGDVAVVVGAHASANQMEAPSSATQHQPQQQQQQPTNNNNNNNNNTITTTDAAAAQSGMDAAAANNKRNNATLVEKNMEIEAATKIQAGFRGYQVRKQMKTKNVDTPKGQRRSAAKSGKKAAAAAKATTTTENGGELEERSATKIQAGIRGFLVRRRHQKNAKPEMGDA